MTNDFPLEPFDINQFGNMIGKEFLLIIRDNRTESTANPQYKKGSTYGGLFEILLRQPNFLEAYFFAVSTRVIFSNDQNPGRTMTFPAPYLFTLNSVELSPERVLVGNAGEYNMATNQVTSVLERQIFLYLEDVENDTILRQRGILGQPTS